jgi:Caspase domain
MKRQALVVGINRYPNLKQTATSEAPHLEKAATDAEAIAQMLEKPSGELAWSVRRLPEVVQEGRFRVGDMTTVSEDELSRSISELLHPEPYHVPDVALLFFAGHGLRKQEDGQTEGFLATSDANTRTKWGISLNWLRQQLLTSSVKQQIVWLDCCHSGELMNFLTEEELRDWLSGGDRLLLAACRGDREAYALGDHGVLTEILLQGLDPQNYPLGKWITSWVLVEFIEKQLDNNWVLKRQIPLSRHFGEKIRLWLGTRSDEIPQKVPLDLGCCDFRIIGPRASGKTTFLATLGYAPNLNSNHVIREIVPRSEDARDLISKAENILEQGLQLEPTDFRYGDDELYYSLLVTLKPHFCNNPIAWLINQESRITLSARDYSGELIEHLQGRNQDKFFVDFLNDCSLASGILVMIDCTTSDYDRKYSRSFTTFQREICYQFKRGGRNLKNYRIAIVLSKFDQSEAWNDRNQVENFVKAKFPQTRKVFHNWSKNWGSPVKYFACSAFGMYGEPPRPNFIGNEEAMGVIANPNQWQPFGLIAPIYWLCTGKIDFRLRDI